MIDSDFFPVIQGKLKVAFAEGYFAQLSKPGGSLLLKLLCHIIASVLSVIVALLIFSIWLSVNKAEEGIFLLNTFCVCVMLLSCFHFFKPTNIRLKYMQVDCGFSAGLPIYVPHYQLVNLEGLSK
jgi:hypothetical protein